MSSPEDTEGRRRQAWNEFAELAAANDVRNPDGLVAKLQSAGLNHPNETTYAWWHERNAKPPEERQVASGRRWIVRELQAMYERHKPAERDSEPSRPLLRWETPSGRKVTLEEAGIVIEHDGQTNVFLFAILASERDELHPLERPHFVGMEVLQRMYHDAQAAEAAVLSGRLV